MHLELDDFNLIISGKVSESERERLVDHVLACDDCATRFRVLNALHQKEKPVNKKGVIRYILGAAAVLFMGAFPYFQSSRQASTPTPIAMTAHVDATASSNPNSNDLGVLKKIQRLNYESAVDRWSTETNLLDILSTQSRM